MSTLKELGFPEYPSWRYLERTDIRRYFNEKWQYVGRIIFKYYSVMRSHGIVRETEKIEQWEEPRVPYEILIDKDALWRNDAAEIWMLQQYEARKQKEKSL